jgi:probable addiction module antidote protein
MKKINKDKRIKVADLPEFDSVPYLDSEEAIAAYMADIMEANDAVLLEKAQNNITRAREINAIVARKTKFTI